MLVADSVANLQANLALNVPAGLAGRHVLGPGREHPTGVDGTGPTQRALRRAGTRVAPGVPDLSGRVE